MRLLPKAFLLAIAITCAAAPSAVAEKRVALVIGNERYTLVPPLHNPGRDARLVAGALQRLGFTLVGGSALADLSKANTDRVVAAFEESAKDADIALFYFSGHGMQVDGVNYLAPIDLEHSSRNTITLRALNADVILRVMESSGAKLKVLLLDACRTNPFLASRGPGSGLAQMNAPEGTIIGFATQPNAIASDGPRGGNGPYAKALDTYLRVQGLDVFALLNEVGLSVMRTTHNAQRPWIGASPISGKVFLNQPSVAMGSATSPPIVFTGYTSNGASLDYIQQAHKLLEQNSYMQARTVLTRAIQADPESPLPYSYRGYSWYLEGTSRTNPSESLAAYREGFPDLDEAIKLDPGYAPVRRHRGNMIVATYKALRALRKPVNDTLDRAINDLRDAVRLSPTSKVNANALGEAYLLKGSYNLAIEAFTSAIARDASYAAPYDGICVAYRMLGRQADANRYAREAAERDSDLRSRPCLTRTL
jgi:tetratricopeptide (TPR) repeat protein